ncbi:MAG: lytic transglycosylase, partial [Candidatus Electrothrix sp. AR3]|nr:lytic transglycosylase [Candidatus Electrothrix sp. AR3]
MPSVGKILALFFFFSAVIAIVEVKADNRFPLYPMIRPNVHFWEKIYGTYTSNQGVLHDKEHLDIVYTVIDLVPKGTPGAGRINKKLMKLARNYYKNILKKFAEGKRPFTREEQRIFNLFRMKNSSNFFQASDNLRFQTGLKNHFRAGVIRSGAYMPAIKRIMRVHGLPLELAYLPHVESSFNVQAHSKAAAVGLWQFTKYTGREFMTINTLVDESFDVYVA